MPGLRDRSTGEILVILIAGTVCFSVMAGGATIGIIEIMHPEADTSSALGTLSDVINTLIGLMAGFLAGRTDTQQEAITTIHKRLDEQRREQ